MGTITTESIHAIADHAAHCLVRSCREDGEWLHGASTLREHFAEDLATGSYDGASIADALLGDLDEDDRETAREAFLTRAAATYREVRDAVEGVDPAILDALARRGYDLDDEETLPIVRAWRDADIDAELAVESIDYGRITPDKLCRCDEIFPSSGCCHDDATTLASVRWVPADRQSDARRAGPSWRESRVCPAAVAELGEAFPGFSEAWDGERWVAASDWRP